ncbi:sugar ABC transporter substrate-binding protein [Frondihabitans sucicola]|uniref:Sugar ABC transporter substrate-binding protein n=1 Tax=Frondihabitans sucicola TaxID=1268041 RepID=A0ABM8GKF4_9MICO|nr:sugar ABC transporter substrate-binding protein [Frondihabitans sucicola]BDZ48861.1 sugar ABC transporter substrate-binding protein [Frondihabitans sucicola]
MKFSTLAAGAVAVALAVSLVGCSSSNSTGGAKKPDKLVILTTNSPSEKALQATGKLYTKKTGIDIQFVDVPYDQLATKLVLAGKSKTSTFDVAMLDPLYLATVAPSGGLLPLDKHLAKDSTYDYSDFPASLKDYPKYKGVTYGLPLSTEPYVQLYRTDLYKKAGITPATTWDQLNSNVKATTSPGSSQYGYAGWYGAQGASAEPYLERLYEYGGRLLDPKTSEPLLNTAVAKKAMKDFLELTADSPEATISGGSPDAATQFSQIPVALDIAPSGWYSTVADPGTSKAAGKVGVAPVPSQAIGKYAPKGILKGWMVGISAQSKYEDASWDFLSFALSKSNVQTFIDSGSPVVARTSTLDDAKYQNQLPYLQYLKPGVVNGVPLPAIPELLPLAVALGNGINSMATQGSKANVDSSMDSLNQKLRQILVDSGRLKK